MKIKKIPSALAGHSSDRAQIEVDIPFHDVDAWNRVWHGNYFKYFEAARTVLFRKKGLDVPECLAKGYIWPVIDCGCRFLSPISYAMRIQVTAILEDIEHRVKVGYVLRDKNTGKKVAKGYTVQVAVHQKTGEMCLVTPDAFLRLLRAK
jgi:acyl-CoA thioester hydrolase